MNLHQSLLVVLTGLLLMAVPVPSRAQVPVHDTFDGPMIDPLKWHGNDSPGVVGTSDLEIRRAIVNGQLQLRLTSYGKTDSNVGQTGFASNRLRLNNPALLTQLLARVTVQQAVAQPCVANTTGSSQPQARLVAAFFNDGSSTGPGVQTGDVQANLQMMLDSRLGHVFVLNVVRCSNPLCTIAPLIGSQTFTRTWTIGQAIRLTLVWDATANKITGLVGGPSNQEAQFVDYGLLALSDVNPPGGDVKELAVTTVEASCTAASRMSQITALFDNFDAK